MHCQNNVLGDQGSLTRSALLGQISISGAQCQRIIMLGKSVSMLMVLPGSSINWFPRLRRIIT